MKFLYKFRFLPVFLGILFLIVGLYYSMIKSGFSNQGQNLEISAKAMLYMNTGENFFRIGMLTIICWVIIYIIQWFLGRKLKKKYHKQ